MGGDCFDLRSFPNYSTADIGPSLDDAIDAAALAQAATVCIPPTELGFSTLVTKVDKNLGTGAAPATIIFRGFGTAIRLALAVVADHSIIVQNSGVAHLHFQDLDISGNPLGGNDCATALAVISGAIDVRIERCQFYGVQSGVASQGIIRLGGRTADINNCGFHGCAATGADSGCIALFMDMQRVDSCFFATQATFRGTTYNKTGGRASIFVRAQAGILDPNVAGVAPNAPVGYAGISRTFFDDSTVTEGQIKCKPIDEPGLDHVEVWGSYFTLPPPTAGAGLLTQTGDSGLGVGFGTNVLTSRDCAFQGGAELAPRLADLQNLGRFFLEKATLRGANPPMVVKVRDLVTEIQVKDWLFDRPALDTSSNLPTRAFYVVSGLQTEFPANVETPVGWWAADSGITLAAGSVSAWASQNGASDATKIVVQAVAGNRPPYTRRNATYNNLPTLTFAAASSHFLSSGAFGAALVAPLTWYIVAHANDTASPKCFFDGNTAGARNQFDATAVGETAQFFAGAGAALGVTALTAPFVGCVTIPAGGASTIYVNNSQAADGAGLAGNQGIAGISIGIAFDGASEPLDGTIAEIILFPSAHSAAQRARVFAYLGQKYGIATS
jgi:hypothetical protein